MDQLPQLTVLEVVADDLWCAWCALPTRFVAIVACEPEVELVTASICSQCDQASLVDDSARRG